MTSSCSSLTTLSCKAPLHTGQARICISSFFIGRYCTRFRIRRTERQNVIIVNRRINDCPNQEDL